MIFSNIFGKHKIAEKLPKQITEATPRLEQMHSGAALPRIELVFDKLKFGDFPEITEGKIKDNKIFLDRKEFYVRAALEAVQPYYEYVRHLPPISKDKDMSLCLRYIIARTIAIYWDLPASAMHHDCEKFGLLKHSILTATNEAERLSRINKYSEIAGIDSEQTRKQRPQIVMCGFLTGLLHDADKLLNIKLTCEMQNSVNKFNPLYGSGSILDFKLAFPREQMTLEWGENPVPNLSLGLHYMYSITPKQFREGLTGRLWEYIHATLKNYKSEADHVAVRAGQEADQYVIEISKALNETLSKKDILNVPGGYLFKVSKAWYVVFERPFWTDLNRTMQTVEKTLEKTLIDNDLVFSHPSSGSVFDLNCIVAGKPCKKTVSFLRAELFERLPALSGVTVSLGTLRFKAGHSTFLNTLGLKLPPSSFEEQDKNALESSENTNLDNLSPSSKDHSHDTNLVDDSIEPPAIRISRGTGEKIVQPPQANVEKIAECPEDTHSESVTTHNDGSDYDADGYVIIPEFKGHKSVVAKKQMSKDLYNALPHLQMVLLSALANTLGVADATEVVPRTIFQRTNDVRSIFYLLENQTILARSPKVLQFAWVIFCHEKKKKLHEWSEKIDDLPITFSGVDILGRLLTSYFYKCWSKSGVLIPEGNQYEFSYSNSRMPILISAKSAPEMMEVEGNFINLDAHNLSQYLTNRVGTKSIQQSLNYYYKLLYGKAWS